MSATIYAIYEKETGLVKYVGRTNDNNYEYRKSFHFDPGSGTGYSVHDLMESEKGVENYDCMKLIEHVDDEDAAKMEDFYIIKYYKMGNKLWNRTTNYKSDIDLPSLADRLNTEEARIRAKEAKLDKYGNEFGNWAKGLETQAQKYNGDCMGQCHTDAVKELCTKIRLEKYGYKWGACMTPLSRVRAKRSMAIKNKHVFLFYNQFVWGLTELFGYLTERCEYETTYEELKYICNYKEAYSNTKLPNHIVETIINNGKALELAPLMKDYDINLLKSPYKNTGALKVYSANPWFNDEQMERSEFMRKTLTDLGFDVFDPKSTGVVSSASNMDFRKMCFQGNLNAIDHSDFILAVTDGKDMGVCIECGAAYACDIPIIYFAETLGDRPFNLMLACTGIHVITSRKQLVEDLQNPKLLECIKDHRVYKEYTGNTQ